MQFAADGANGSSNQELFPDDLAANRPSPLHLGLSCQTWGCPARLGAVLPDSSAKGSSTGPVSMPVMYLQPETLYYPIFLYDGFFILHRGDATSRCQGFPLSTLNSPAISLSTSSAYIIH